MGKINDEKLKLWKKQIKGKTRIYILMKQTTFYKGKLTLSPSQTWFKRAFNALYNNFYIEVKHSGLCSAATQYVA